MTSDEVRDRFRRVVARGLERADRELAEHHARIRALPPVSSAGRARIAELLRPPRRLRRERP